VQEETEVQPLRRRGERMRQAVLDATVRMLVAEGLTGTTVAAVARAAGVHETSVYRRWKTRDALIVDALSGHLDQTLPLPDTGDVREDLVTFFGRLARILATPQGAALLSIGANQPGAVAQDESRRFWTSRFERGEIIVERGITAGELARDTDPKLVLDAVGGPLFTRVLLTGAPLDDSLVPRLVDLILDGARPTE
jgi:AcrR family transcriptional regulator